MNTYSIVLAAVAANMLLPAQSFADAEAVARENLRAFIANNPPPDQGCFHVSSSNLVWEHAQCSQTPPRAHPLRAHRSAEAPQVAGSRSDYVVQAPGLISDVQGNFVGINVG